jgi:hypothetical protein
MQNGARPVVLALFFVLGMAFTAAMFLFARPDWENHEKVRIVTEQSRINRIRFLREQNQAETAPPTAASSSPAPTATIPPEDKTVTQPTPGQSASVPSELNLDNNEQPSPVAPIRMAAAPSTITSVKKPKNEPQTLSVRNEGAAKTLRGRAILIGQPPPDKPLPFDPSCGELVKELRTTRFFVVGPDNGLGNVVVKVTGLPKRHWMTPVEMHIISARQCFFEPYVSAMQFGQRLEVKNEDPFLHNAHMQFLNGEERNFTLMPRNKIRPVMPTESNDFIRIKSDVRPWMFAYITVVEHPYFAVSDAEGKFEIKGLPVGTYDLEATHLKSGANRKRVEIRDDGGEVEFRFTPTTYLKGPYD